MDINDIEPGQIVQLNSGGPVMTVRVIVQGSTPIICVWMDDTYCMHEGNFASVCLKKY